MKARASRAVPIYIFSASSFLRAKWYKFCFLCAPLKFRRREKCFDLGTNRHRESLWCELFRRSPSQNVQRVFLARVPFIVLYILSLPSPFCQFSPPLIFRPFSAPPLAQPSLPLPRSPHPPHPFDSCSKENHSCSKEISVRFVRKQPFQTVTRALQTAR